MIKAPDIRRWLGILFLIFIAVYAFRNYEKAEAFFRKIISDEPASPRTVRKEIVCPDCNGSKKVRVTNEQRTRAEDEWQRMTGKMNLKNTQSMNRESRHTKTVKCPKCGGTGRVMADVPAD